MLMLMAKNEDNQVSDVGLQQDFLCLSGCLRLDASMAAHQAAKFSNDPNTAHDTAVKRIGKSLLGTSDKVLELKPDATKLLQVYVDADCDDAHDSSNIDHPASVCSRNRFDIKHTK